MTLHSLLHYIVKHPHTRVSISLKQLAAKVQQHSNKKAELLCDLSLVARWVLSGHDCEQIRNGKLSPYSTLYGGDLKAYGECILKFVETLEMVGIRPVFFVGGPPGSEKEDFSIKFDQFKEDTLRMQERCANIEQICAGNRFLQIAWNLSEAMSMQVQRVLWAAGVCVINCFGEPLAEMVQYSRLHGSQIVGVVSRSVELIVNVPGLSMIIPDVVGAGGAILKALADEMCQAVSSESLTRALGLTEQQLADLAAIICGSDGSLLAELCLDSDCNIESVAKWLQDQQQPIHELYPQCKEVMVQIQSRFLIPLNEEKRTPESQLDNCKLAKIDDPSDNSESFDKTETIPRTLAEVVHIKVQAGAMLPHLLSMVQGRFWRSSAVELASLGQPCINDLTLVLRTSLYSLMGLENVTEYGRTSIRTFDTIPIHLKTHVTCGLSQLKALEERTKNERLSLLFDLVGNQQRYQDCTNLEDCVSAACKIGSEIDKPISSAAVVVCASLLLLFQANEVLSSFSGLNYNELDAFLVTCLTCMAEYPPCALLCRPPVRAVSIAMHFSHILEQVYVVASYLGLLDELPAPASLFHSMAYIPYHIVGCSEAPTSHLDASNLAMIRNHFLSLSNLEPVIAFRAEIVNEWRDPNLVSFLERFSLSLDAVASYKAQKESTLSLSSIGGGGFSMCIERTDDLDLSSSVDSNASSIVKCGELSSAQDYKATEEDIFFATLFDDASNGVDDIIDSNDDITGDEIFDDDNIFSFSDVEQQLKSGSDEALTTTTGSAPVSIETSKLAQPKNVHQDVNPKSTIVDTLPPKSASVDESAAPTQPYTSSTTLSGPRSNPRSHHFNPRSRSHPTPPLGKDENELPIMAHRERILQLVHSHRVVCIEGETGCGKSTKIPQFILEDSLNTNPATPCKILVTQPRRVAVIKLAERVAAERRERLGQTVGYCIGGERHRTSETSLTYCTVGYLLQALVHNPSMILQYTHIILDEIHERSTDADFALIIVRKLVAASECLKVVIMSATMEGHTIANYFEQAINFNEVADPYCVGAKRYKVEQYFIDELDQLLNLKKPVWSEWQATASSNLRQQILQQPPENLQEALSRKPAVTLFAQNICTELIISQASLGEQILVFLPGISEIATYYDLLTSVLKLRDIQDHFSVFVMHSQVPFEDQKEIFNPPPPFRAHVILATNIAESSITLPKLRMVINFGIYRQLEYNSKCHMSQLTKKWCSQASCAQRAGRAGRVFEGVAVHLFTKRFYWVIIPEFDPPEILHAPLAKLVLQAKQIGSKMGILLPSEFLSQAVDPPSLEQMELALQELASFGAIISQPGSPVSEQAEITLLGRFALTLPLDIEFSRLVLYGIFFGIPTDAIVIAAAASLSQDVFSLPTRMVIKEDSIYSESLKRSMKARCYFDGGQYSDPVVICNLFREWIEYRNHCACDESPPSKRHFFSNFCNSRAIRWQRLLLLEHSVAEVASRVLSHIPKDYHLYDEIHVLSDITRYRRGFGFMSSLEESCENGSNERHRRLRLSSITLHFCDSTNTLKALLAASFTHNLIIGHRGLESPDSKERKRTVQTLAVMSDLSYDPSETVTLKSDNNASIQDIQHLVSMVLPHRYCEAQCVDRTWYVHFHPEFSNNPKTALMRAQMAGESEPQAASVGKFLTDISVVQQKLSLDVCYFWQYGERKPTWKVANATFTKPRHPLAVSWTRISKEKETVLFNEWRNPSGFVCDTGLECPPFLGVVSTVQGIQHRNVISARGITILPSLSNGKEALLMLLAFHSQGVKIKFIVSKNTISGVQVDSTLLSLPISHLRRISAGDIVRINELRRAMSTMMRINIQGGSYLFPVEEMSTIHSLLKCVLKGQPSNLTTPLEQSSLPTETCIATLHDDEDGTDSEFDFDIGNEEEIALDCFDFYPPLQCTLLDTVSCQSIPQESLEVDYLFQKKTTSGGVGEGMAALSPSELFHHDLLEDVPHNSKRRLQKESEQQGQLSQSYQLLESAQSGQFLEPDQLSMSDQLPMPHKHPMSDQLACSGQLLVTEQLYPPQQQLLEQEGVKLSRLSPLAEPFVPTNVSNFDPVLSAPLPVATHNQGTQGSVPFHNVHNQDSSVQIPNIQHMTTLQNISDISVQSTPVSIQNVSGTSFSGAGFRGRQQPKISNVIDTPPRVEPSPECRGVQRIVPPSPPSLATHPYNLQPNYQANLISIIFHLLDKASCKPAGEGELEVQKAKLLCQNLMLISGQPQPNVPHSYLSLHGQSHPGPPPGYGPCPAPRGSEQNPGSPTVRSLPATLSASSAKAPKIQRESEPRSKIEGASDVSGMKPNNELDSKNAPSLGSSEGEQALHGGSVEKALARLLQSPTTALMEEHSQDHMNPVGVASGNNGISIHQGTRDKSCRDTASTTDKDKKNAFQVQTVNSPQDEVESEKVEGGIAVKSGDRVETRKQEITSTEATVILDHVSEMPPVQEGITSSVRETSPPPVHSLSPADVPVCSSNIETSSASSLAENVTPPTTSSQDVATEPSPVISAQSPVYDTPPSNSVQGAIINQGDTQGLTDNVIPSPISHLEENKTPPPANSPQRDSLSPINTAASPLKQIEPAKSQRHLSDPPAGGIRSIPKVATSQLAQALLSPPQRYPLHRSILSPVSLNHLVALQSNRPFSALLSPPKRPCFYGPGVLHHSAPAIAGHVFDTACQMRPSMSSPSLSSSCATHSLDFSTHPSQPASVVLGVGSVPNGGTLLPRTTKVNSDLHVPQRPQPPPPPPPGFAVPTTQLPQLEGQRSPPTGGQASYVSEALQPPMQPPPSSANLPASLPFRLVKMKDLNAPVLDDGLLATPPQPFLTHPPPPPPHDGEQNLPAAMFCAPISMPPPSSHGHVPPGRRMPTCKKRTPHHMQHAMPLLRYQGPPPFPLQSHGTPDGSFPHPPPGLGWPLSPPPSRCRRRGKGPPPAPHPDLFMNYTARHKTSPLISALIPDPLHHHFQNYQASGLHIQPLQYNRSLNNNNKKERKIPSYTEFGIPGEQLMQYYCTMLATEGRDLELNLLCGPYYRDLLRCYKVCARENELLSPSFFDQYSCFTVYGEPGRYMVKLNPVAKEGHMTEPHHTSSVDTNDAPPPTGAKSSKEGTAVRNGNITASFSLVGEEHSVVPHQQVAKEKCIDTATESVPQKEVPEEKSVVRKTDIETLKTAEVPSYSNGDGQKASSTDTEHITIEYQVSKAVTQLEVKERNDQVKSSEVDGACMCEYVIATDSLTAAVGLAKEKWDKEDEENSTRPLTLNTDTVRPDHLYAPVSSTSTISEVTLRATAGSKEEISDIPQPVTSGDKEVEIEEKQAHITIVSDSTVSGVTQPTECFTREDGSDITIAQAFTGVVEIEEKEPLISVTSVSRVSEMTQPMESSTMEDWDIITEPGVTSGDIEQEVKDTQSVGFVASASAISEVTQSTANEGQDDVAKPVTVEVEVKEGQSHISILSASLSSEVTKSITEDWDVSEQLPLPSTTADEHLCREETPTSVYDEDCWVEGEQPASCTQPDPEVVAPPTQLESEGPTVQTSVTVFDEECWEENVVPESVDIKRIESKPIRILKREESPKCDEPIGAQWYEYKPAASLPPTHIRRATGSGGVRQESSGGGGRKYKNKKKRKNRQGQQEDKQVHFSPAPQAEASSTWGRSRGEFDRDGSSGRKREGQEYRRSKWSTGSTGRRNNYGSGWSRDRREEQRDQSGKK